MSVQEKLHFCDSLQEAETAERERPGAGLQRAGRSYCSHAPSQTPDKTQHRLRTVLWTLRMSPSLEKSAECSNDCM